MKKRRVTGIRKPGPIKALDRYADETLRVCAERWEAAADLDTAVRDDVAQGLAYLVYSAYDSISASKAIGWGADDYSSSYAFVAGSTAQWFRERGFAEWFCVAAGSLFNNQRPRIKEQLPFGTRRRRKIRRVKAKAA